MELSAAHRRFARWVTESEVSQRELARILESSAGMVSDLCAGRRFPGRKLANDIERETAVKRGKWKGHSIRSEEWDAAERALAKTGTDGR
jgi:ribosome-binding protein aMBF1 (putative translation factor)